MLPRGNLDVYIGRVSEPTILDLRGLWCPLPVLRTRRALRRLPPGAALVVFSTDPLAEVDIPHMVAEDGHTLVRRWRERDASAFHILKSIGAFDRHVDGMPT